MGLLDTFLVTVINIRAISGGRFGSTGCCKSLHEVMRSLLQRDYNQGRRSGRHITLPTSPSKNPSPSVFSVDLDTLGVIVTFWWGWWRTSPFDEIIEGEQGRQIFHRCPCEQVLNTNNGFIVPNAIPLFAAIQDTSYEDITKGNLIWCPIGNYSREGASFPGKWQDFSSKKKNILGNGEQQTHFSSCVLGSFPTQCLSPSRPQAVL